MRAAYFKPIGYSCHAPGIDSCILAAKDYGAHVIEKHFTIEQISEYKSIYRDYNHAVMPDEFAQLVKSIGG